MNEDEVEPSEAEKQRTIRTLEEEEAVLEAALDGIRAWKKKLEDDQGPPDER